MTFQHPFGSLRIAVVLAAASAAALWAVGASSAVLAAALCIVAVAGLGYIATWLGFGEDLSSLERVGASALLAFLATGLAALVLALSPIGLTRDTAALALITEVFAAWVGAECRLPRSASARGADQVYDSRNECHSSKAMGGRAGPTLIAASALAAAIYVVAGYGPREVGYTELYLVAATSDALQVAVVNQEGETIVYRIAAIADGKELASRVLPLGDGESIAVSLPRAATTTRVLLFADGHQEPHRSLVIRKGADGS